MAEAIRNLQLFRNDTNALLTGTAAEVRTLVENAYTGGNLILNDGEPISVRYMDSDANTIKGLFGVAYDDGNSTKKILWGASGDNVNITTEPEYDKYVTLRYTYDASNNHYHLIADANVVSLDEACKLTIIITVLSDELYYREDEHSEPIKLQAGDEIEIVDTDNYWERLFKDIECTEVAENGVDYESDEGKLSGLADACDVKSHIKYYNVVSGDNIVTVSSSTMQDVNGFDKTTFTVSISTSNLPAAPEYTIGTVSAIGTSLKSYALFKDGVQVGETIDIPKDFLVKSGNIIEIVEDNGQFYDETHDPGHTTPLTGVSAAGLYLDFVVNVKTGTAEPDEHIYIPVDSLVDAYTAGDGITISTTNVVSARISNDNNNQVRISQNDGGLFVPAGDTIVDVNTIVSTCIGTAEEPVYYGYENGQYVVITKTGSNPDTYEYNGQPYTGPHGGPVPCGHKYLVVRTSGGNIYLANNDTSADVHVQSFTIGSDTNNNDALIITMNNTVEHSVTISSIAELLPTIPSAIVNWNIGSDTLEIGTEGILTQLAISTIEEYIDNFDCGTFIISTTI